jgi:hypothetical protein
MRTLYACQRCGAEYGEGEEDRGRSPCCLAEGDPIGTLEDEEDADDPCAPNTTWASQGPQRKEDRMASEEQCPVCAGQQTIPCRVQRLIHGRRTCSMETMPCPVCKGTGIATAKDVEAFLDNHD